MPSPDSSLEGSSQVQNVILLPKEFELEELLGTLAHDGGRVDRWANWIILGSKYPFSMHTRYGTGLVWECSWNPGKAIPGMRFSKSLLLQETIVKEASPAELKAWIAVRAP